MRGNSKYFSSENPFGVCVKNETANIRVQIMQSKSEEMQRKTTEEERKRYIYIYREEVSQPSL